MTNSRFYIDRELSNPDLTAVLIDTNNSTIIAKGILENNTYGYSVQNSWGENSTFMDTMLETIGGMATSTAGKMASKSVELIASLFGFGDIGEKFSQVSQGHIYSAGKTIKAFQGTDIEVGNLNFKTRFLATNSEPGYVRNNIKRIRKYAIGKAVDLGGVSDIFGVQLPPNDYEWLPGGLSTKDGYVKNTLTLVIGNFFRIDNLLVSNFEVEYSAQKVLESSGNQEINKIKFLTKSDSSGVDPLYADVTISFTLAKKMNLVDLIRMTPTARVISDKSLPLGDGIAGGFITPDKVDNIDGMKTELEETSMSAEDYKDLVRKKISLIEEMENNNNSISISDNSTDSSNTSITNNQPRPIDTDNIV